MAKKQQGGGGAPEWLVTFADLMSLLVCFFVLLISFSVQDTQKLQVVAGSVKEAFGIQSEQRRAGVIEIDGSPMRRYIRRQTLEPSDQKETDEALEEALKKANQYPEQATSDIKPIDSQYTGKYASAAVSLRQAWQQLPEVTELSKSVIMHEDEKGLNIQLVDQDGRAMFPPHSKQPSQHIKQLLTAMAKVLRNMPNQIAISGHSTAGKDPKNPQLSNWQLTSERANAARKILSEAGVPDSQIYSVTGMAANSPLFPNSPFLAANRRISIVLMKEPPPIPNNYEP